MHYTEYRVSVYSGVLNAKAPGSYLSVLRQVVMGQGWTLVLCFTYRLRLVDHALHNLLPKGPLHSLGAVEWKRIATGEIILQGCMDQCIQCFLKFYFTD